MKYLLVWAITALLAAYSLAKPGALRKMSHISPPPQYPSPSTSPEPYGEMTTPSPLPDGNSNSTEPEPSETAAPNASPPPSENGPQPIPSAPVASTPMPTPSISTTPSHSPVPLFEAGDSRLYQVSRLDLLSTVSLSQVEQILTQGLKTMVEVAQIQPKNLGVDFAALSGNTESTSNLQITLILVFKSPSEARLAKMVLLPQYDVFKSAVSDLLRDVS